MHIPYEYSYSYEYSEAPHSSSTQMKQGNLC